MTPLFYVNTSHILWYGWGQLWSAVSDGVNALDSECLHLVREFEVGSLECAYQPPLPAPKLVYFLLCDP